MIGLTDSSAVAARATGPRFDRLGIFRMIPRHLGECEQIVARSFSRRESDPSCDQFDAVTSLARVAIDEKLGRARSSSRRTKLVRDCGPPFGGTGDLAQIAGRHRLLFEGGEQCPVGFGRTRVLYMEKPYCGLTAASRGTE